MLFDAERIKTFYQNLPSRIKKIRETVIRPMTLTEKILYLHCSEDISEVVLRGNSYMEVFPDRVAMQDATAQMALLQFASSGKKKTAVPTSVHCDHLIVSELGAHEDLKRANQENKEIYDFLQSCSSKYGVDFWKPGAGIMHQVFFEKYAFPGGMMIGTDSHTPNAGGMGMLAVAVGGADAVHVMAGLAWEIRTPRIIGVHLIGQLSGWASPKDVILKLTGLLSVKGGVDSIIEYFGEGAQSISSTGKSSICNMGVEMGAISSIFPYDLRMADYLIATGRKEVAEWANSVQEHLVADSLVLADPQKYYDQVIEMDLSEIEPHINGPYSPDNAWKLSEFADIVRQNGYPEKLSVALIGSGANSSYEDMDRVAGLSRQALKHGFKSKCPLMITPGSEQIHSTIEQGGQLEVFENMGALMLASACGPCIGQWKRNDVDFGEKNSILSSYNRNFSGRHDSNPGTHSFLASPELVAAFALAGRLTFNPMIDVLITEQGLPVRLAVPSGEEFPKDGFEENLNGYIPPMEDGFNVQVIVDPNSKRLHLLEPFKAWSEKDFIDMRVLLKVSGKCTTDHISPGGKWLKYKGHLENISDNMFTMAINAFKEEVGKGKNLLNGELELFSTIARDYKKEGIGWVVIADENYGEGSPREHAAMELRYLGGKAVIAKSFARVHENTLKKQGVLALTFAKSDDYLKIREDDFLAIEGLIDLATEIPLELALKHADGTQEKIILNHSYNQQQIEWFKAGSALNVIR